MDAFIDFMLQYGYVGMFIAAFAAGSVFPFSSEAVLAGLQLAGMREMPLFLSATIGNCLGSMLNYWIGHFGRLEWIERYLHVPPDKVHSTQEWLNHGGAWMGVLTFIPILGDVISVTLGFMRANVVQTTISIFLGKALRYAILIWAINMV